MGSLHLLGVGKQIWKETDLVTKNTLSYININQVHDHFGVAFRMALPGFMPSQVLITLPQSTRRVKLGHSSYQKKVKVFSKLNEWDAIKEKNIRVVEGFVCTMYGKKRL